MKNFLDLLDTDLQLIVTVNDNQHFAGLLDTFSFDKNDIVLIDGIEILPHYRHLVVGDFLEITEPFYCWYHRISGQGWLLKPQ